MTANAAAINYKMCCSVILKQQVRLHYQYLLICCPPQSVAESADASRILTTVPQSDWKRPAGHPHASWLATVKNDLQSHNLSVEDAAELTLERPLWRLLAATGATH